MTEIRLGRAPSTEEELWYLVRALWGITIPREKVCEGHSSPFEAFAHAYFAKSPNWSLWYASRGSGKSLMLALLALTKCFVQDVDVTLLGGSFSQSQNVHEHTERLLGYKDAPRYSLGKPPTATEIMSTSGKTIRPLPASQKTVRGPHPNCTLLDEIDEMEWDIYSAAMGQAMPRINGRGEEIPEYTVASSTWQHADKTFQKVKEEAEGKGFPVFSFCYRENLRPHGWLDSDFIDRKRASVPAEMFRVEFDLGEPSGTSRAFDPMKVEKYFTVIGEIRGSHVQGDDEYVFEDPIPGSMYAIGADWAKEEDFTCIVVVKLDVLPRQCVYFRRVQRRPYPDMVEMFSRARSRYQAVGAHDGTGLGNVVHDMIEADGSTLTKFVMVGRPRTQMLTDYITAFENGWYELPRQTRMFHEHKYASVADVWAPGKWDSHLPDSVAAMALAHRAAEKMAPAGTPAYVQKGVHYPGMPVPGGSKAAGDPLKGFADDYETAGEPKVHELDGVGVFRL